MVSRKPKAAPAVERKPYEDVPGLEHVPTVPELVKQQLAAPAGAAGGYRISPAGQQMIYAAMSRNAQRARAWLARPKGSQS